MAASGAASPSRQAPGWGPRSGFELDDDIESQVSNSTPSEASYNRSFGLHASPHKSDEVMSQTSASPSTFVTADEGSSYSPSNGGGKAKGKGKGKSGRRNEDIDRLFRALLDMGAGEGASVLTAGEEELGRFAEFCGFDAGPEEWALEYKTLCAEYGWDPVLGIDKVQFANFVTDKTSSGYCTCQELRSILQEMGVFSALEKQNEIMRVSRIHSIFKALDTADTGRVCQVALLPYARLRGFKGSSQEWLQEYQFQCERNMWDCALGLDAAQFAHLVNGFCGRDYCSTAELREILEHLQSQSQ